LHDRRFLRVVDASYPLGGDRVALRLLDGTTITVQADWRPVLNGCKGAQTLDDHAIAIERERGLHPQQRAVTRQALASLAAAGALACYEDLSSAVHGEGEAATSASRITSLVIPTCDRPEPLERCILSFARNAREHGRRVDVIVGDDARGADSRARLRERLTALSRSADISIRYAGTEEKQQFIAALEGASGVPAEVLAFALLGPGDESPRTGANRNALLLDAVGELCVSVDDDTLCQLTPHPQHADGLRFADDSDPTEFWFYPGRDAALAAARFGAHDFLGLHEQLLGKSVTGLLAAPDVSVRGAGHYLARALVHGRGRVAVTYNGVLGDSGMHTGANVRYLRGATRERLVRNEADYRTALRSREVLRVVQAPTVCGGPPFMGTFFGLDATRPLPPFLPTRLNEDGVFGFTLVHCFADACFGHVPFAALHAPAGARSYAPEGTDIETFRLSELIIQCVSQASRPDSLAWDAALGVAGALLVTASSWPQPVFDRFVNDVVCRYAASRIGHHARMLGVYQRQPKFWSDDILARIRKLEHRLTCEDYYVPADVEGSSLAERRARTRTLVGQWGRLLASWPAVLDGARVLKARGRRLSVAL
jgi:hypothetical protein